jgi:hypothetical protein
LIVLTISIAGCGRPNAVSKSDDTTENQAILTKLRGYIECLRDHSSQVFKVADLYAKHNDGKPPNAGQRVPLFATSDPAPCLEAISDSRALEPILPELVTAGDDFAKTVKTVFELTTRGHRAFDRTNPGSYNPAQGIALHPQLLAAFAAFDTAQARLFDEVHRLNRSVHSAQLARREEREGRTLPVLADNLRFQAEGLVRFAATRWDHLDGLDLEAFHVQLEAFDYLLEEVHSAVTADPKEGGDFNWILKLARQYQTAGRQMLQRARTKVAFSETEKLMIAADNERSVIGSPAAMLETYNELVTWQ